MESATAEDLFCPWCTYNLRGLPTPRCPECGRPFDPATAAVTRIPWAHRHDLGRWRAYGRTLGLALRRPGRLGDEVARPIAWPDASRFRWLTVAGLALLATGLCAALYPWMDLSSLAVDTTAPIFAGYTAIMGGRGVDLSLWWWPAAALLTGPGLILVVGLGLAAGLGLVTWWVRAWFWMLGGPRRERATAVGCYASAWLIPVLAGAAALAACGIAEGRWGMVAAATATESKVLRLAVGLALGVVLYGPLICWWVGTLITLQRATRCGWMMLGLAGMALPAGAAALLSAGVLAVSYVLGLLALMGLSLLN